MRCNRGSVLTRRTAAAPVPGSPGAPSRAHRLVAAALIAAAALVAYANTMRVPFVFDDVSGILSNPSIRKLQDLGAVLQPPTKTTLSGRPIANLSLAINYWADGTSTWGYHALNLLIHVLGGIALFGIVRRTLRLPVLEGRFGEDAPFLAVLIALLWAVHPLQTEAVTYVVQRVESLAGLFYLLTLYAFIRSAGSPRPRAWQAGAAVACLLGMLTKEVMVTAPLIVFLYDRTFISGSFSRVWRDRRGFYLTLAATWAPLVVLAAGGSSRLHESAGFGMPVDAFSYWTTQLYAVARYLRLSFWPHPLVFDYGTYLAPLDLKLAACAVLAAVLAVLTAVALWRRPALGFLGAWFLVILSPTLLVPIATQTLAEHRMYLPLAAVICLFVLGGYSLAGRLFMAPAAALVAACIFATVGRNAVYRSELFLWGDTAAHWPGNARAHCSLGLALSHVPGELSRAVAEYQAAIRIHPDYADAHNDLGIALGTLQGGLDEAAHEFREALRIRPDFAEAHNNLGLALARKHDVPEAAEEYQEALRLRPTYPEAHGNLGALLSDAGRGPEAVVELESALGSDPANPQTHFYLANAFVETGRGEEAIEQYNVALQEQPDFPEASNNLGMMLFRSGHTSEGIGRIEAAIRMRPDFVQAHFALGAAYMQAGRKADALPEYRKVLELRPGDPSALRMVGLLESGQ